MLAKYSNSTLIGADTSFYSPGRVSRHCHKFRQLPPLDSKDPSRYIQAMLDIVDQENVDLWISCSGVSTAVEDAQVKEILEKRTQCKAVQFGVEATKTLHDKDSFINFIRDECTLTVPETVEVTSYDDVLEVLLPEHHESNGNGKHNKPVHHKSKKHRLDEMMGPPEDSWWLPKASTDRQFILKPVGVDDQFRADMTLLPFSEQDVPGDKAAEEATRRHVKRLPISASKPWLLQEYIKGKEFCTHSLVVNGEVKCFVACPSAELLMHYEALPPPSESNLTAAMLKFTERVAEVMQRNSTDAGNGGFTGHLSFDFLVKHEDLDSDGEEEEREITLYPIECNPRAHTAVVLFRNCPEAATAYLDIIRGGGKKIANGNRHGEAHSTGEPLYPMNPSRYYWLPHDMFSLLIIPILSLAFSFVSAFLPSDWSLSTGSRPAIFSDAQTLIGHAIFWRDGSFTFDDPLPAWWLYHVYWPMQFLESLRTGKRWSRINVSTTKMFGLE